MGVESVQNDMNHNDRFIEQIYDVHNMVLEPAQNGNENHIEDESLRRSTRIRRTPTFLEDYHHQLMLFPHDKRMDKNNRICYSLDLVISHKNLSDK